jgi:hypothetical protein
MKSRYGRKPQRNTFHPLRPVDPYGSRIMTRRRGRR